MRVLKFTELSVDDSKMLKLARSINVVAGAWEDSDLDLFFGPLEESDITLEIPNDLPWDKVLVACGFFSSRREAKGAGWDKNISVGFSIHKIGKLRREIAALRRVMIHCPECVD